MILQKSSLKVPRVLRSAPIITRSLSAEAQTQSPSSRKEGDISSVFKSLSGGEPEPLPPRFAQIKRNLIAGNEEAIQSSWNELLTKLSTSTKTIAKLGSAAIPTIDFSSIENNNTSSLATFGAELKERGVAVIKGVVTEEEALNWKYDVKEYIQKNPQTKAFPKDDPQVYELYWSPSQVKARAHPNILKAQKFAMSHWHSSKPSAPISTNHPLTYADRLRIRQPGDAGFALGPHVDGGSVERWEPTGYGAGKVYSKIFSGKWQDYDPWESSCRLNATSDLYNGSGACSMFRMFQGWLSLSNTGPGEGTLLINPLLKESTTYYLLRPFFTPVISKPACKTEEQYLSPQNWKLQNPKDIDSTLHGAYPGLGQELSNQDHPHLSLKSTMIHIPQVKPGDYVLWHCDTIHAVDKLHSGKEDSSVMYIPACPLTKSNVEYLVKQKEAFAAGWPAPDFPGGVGETGHEDRAWVGELGRHGGRVAMGLGRFEVGGRRTSGEDEVVAVGNRILGF